MRLEMPCSQKGAFCVPDPLLFLTHTLPVTAPVSTVRRILVRRARLRQAHAFDYGCGRGDFRIPAVIQIVPLLASRLRSLCDRFCFRMPLLMAKRELLHRLMTSHRDYTCNTKFRS